MSIGGSKLKKCAPARISGGDAKITCYSKESLVKMAQSFNTHVSNNSVGGKQSVKGSKGSKLKQVRFKSVSGLVNNMMPFVNDTDNNGRAAGGIGGKKIAYKGKTKKQIWSQLSDRLFSQCGGNEMCWKEQPFVKMIGNREINEKTFKPKMPVSWKKRPSEWLSTTNISNVMKQYEDVYDDFVYLGTVPRDCPSGVSCHLSNIDLKKLYKKYGIKRVGLVYNLDLHYQSGSHWVAVFMDFNKKNATYFDSYGDKPPRMILQFIQKCMSQMKNIGIDMNYEYNNKRHQYGGSECGIYSCNFIIKSLEGKSLKQLSSKRIPDKKMNELRKQLFIAN